MNKQYLSEMGRIIKFSELDNDIQKSFFATEEVLKEKGFLFYPEDNEKISWSFHVVRKLRVKGLRREHVEDSLKECIIIEEYEGTPWLSGFGIYWFSSITK